MAEVLSQNEIDALLSAVSTGSVETAGGGTPAPETHASTRRKPMEWVAYDLATQEKVVKGKFSALEGIHDRFSRLFRKTLGTALKRNVTVTHANTNFIQLSEYLQNILVPASMNIISMKNLSGHMVIVFTSKLTYALVDAYYGGCERPFSKIGGSEEFTQIENNMIRKVCDLAIRDLSEAWKLNYPLELEYIRTESNPQFLGAIHSSESVAVVTYEVEFENLSGPISVIVQLRALDPIQQFLAINVTGEFISNPEMWRSHWLNELFAMPLDVRVELGAFERTLSEIRALKKDEVIILDRDAQGELPVCVEGVDKYKGLTGAYRGNRAVRILNIVEPRKSGGDNGNS